MPGRYRSHSIELERHVVAEFQSGETCYALAGRRASIRDGRPGGLWFRQGCELADVARSCFYDKRELGPVLAPVASVSGSNRSSSAMIRRAEITLAPGYSTGRDALLHLPAKALSCRAPKRKNPAGKGGVPKQTSNDISRSVAVAHELIDVFLIEKCKALYQYSASALVCLKKTALKGVIPGEGRSMGEHAVKLANFWKCKLNPDFSCNFNAPRVQASLAGKSAGHATSSSSIEPGNAPNGSAWQGASGGCVRWAAAVRADKADRHRAKPSVPREGNRHGGDKALTGASRWIAGRSLTRAAARAGLMAAMGKPWNDLKTSAPSWRNSNSSLPAEPRPANEPQPSQPGTGWRKD